MDGSRGGESQGLAEAGLSPSEAIRLLEAHGVGTWSWQLETAQVSWSPGMSAILGIEHQPTRQTLAAYEELVHPDDLPDFRNPLRVVTGTSVNDHQYRIIRPTGEMRWIRAFTTLIHSRTGRPERMIGSAFDVTDVHMGMLALQQREGLVGAIRELFDVVVWTTDGNGEISNEVDWWRATGQSGRVDSWNRLAVVHPDDRQKVREAWEEALRNRRRYASSARVKWGDDYVPIVSRGIAVAGPDGQIQSWVGFTARQDGRARDHWITGSPTASVTPGQIRAARGFLGWSAELLAEQSGVSFSTVRRLETPGERGVRMNSVASIRGALERAGISFITGADGTAGVMLK